MEFPRQGMLGGVLYRQSLWSRKVWLGRTLLLVAPAVFHCAATGILHAQSALAPTNYAQVPSGLIFPEPPGSTAVRLGPPLIAPSSESDLAGVGTAAPTPTRADRQASSWTAQQLTAAVPRLARAALQEQVQRHTEKGMALAARGAFFSARREFETALYLIADAYDLVHQSDERRKALTAGLTAFQEVEDFCPAVSGIASQADTDVEKIAVIHRTPVVQQASKKLTAAEAVQAYFAFAQQQISRAVGDEPLAADALYGLARTYICIASQSARPNGLQVPKALALYRTAITAAPDHAQVANELAVLLARYGQWADAKQVLQSVSMEKRTPEMWHNLAVIHERLGEQQWAEEARAHQQAVARRLLQSHIPTETEGNLQWYDVTAWADTAASQGNRSRLSSARSSSTDVTRR